MSRTERVKTQVAKLSGSLYPLSRTIAYLRICSRGRRTRSASSGTTTLQDNKIANHTQVWGMADSSITWTSIMRGTKDLVAVYQQL